MALTIARLRVLLRATGDMHLHPHQAGEIYALVARAWGEGRANEPAVPDGVMIEVPEQCRILVAPGERYAFGLTWLQAEGASLAPSVIALRRGLESVGKTEDRRRPVFGGNFEIVEIRDLVAGVPWSESNEPRRVPESHIVAEVERLRAHDTLRIDFLSPVRIQRPSADRTPGHQHLDDREFSLRSLLDALKRRLEALGFESVAAGLGFDPPPLERTFQGMAWLDLAWGPQNRRKRLGGALGRIAVKVHDPRVLTALVLGQYLQVGSNTRFGFGRYRIRELGNDPLACPRSAGLIELALVHGGLDRIAADLDIESGGLQRAVAEVAAGTYAPDPPTRSRLLAKGKHRELAVPSRQDRALQTVIVRNLAPALDLLFERSSFAYRSGLGTHSAARRIRMAFRNGFVYALKADFRQFFDTVDHRLLETRLRAYLRDDAAADLILAWVWTAAPEKGRGLPTGAPISPLLANLFLDTFDEEIARQGGRLVRYADDFLILFRDPAEATKVLAVAKEAAQALLLELNDTKTKWLDLREPFEFLGIRFERTGQWAAEAPAGPTHLQDLGWHAGRPQHRPELFALPGEADVGSAAADAGTTVILGPRSGTLDIADGHLVFRGESASDVASVPLKHIQQVLALGAPALSAAAVRNLIGRGIPLWAFGGRGNTVGALRAEDDLIPAEVLAAQVRLYDDELRCLDIARPLIAAKLRNYATLSEVTAGPTSAASLPSDLRQLASRAESAPSFSALLGIEGKGAALWYGDFRSRLNESFTWQRRIAPDAPDPVNALLNFAHTVLHKEALATILRAGLAPTLGIFHRARAGHAALASDLQEPFRHLMDRVVLVATRELRGDDFEKQETVPPTVHLRPPALRRFAALVHESFGRSFRLAGQRDALSYRQHMGTLARDIKRCILGGTRLTAFETPRSDASHGSTAEPRRGGPTA